MLSRVTKQTHHEPNVHDHVAYAVLRQHWYIPVLIRRRSLSISIQLTFVRLHLIWLALCGFLRTFAFRVAKHSPQQACAAAPASDQYSQYSVGPDSPPRTLPRSRLGPKSETSRRASQTSLFRSVRVSFLLFCIAQFLLQPAGGVRVAADSTPAAGVDQQQAPSGSSRRAAKPSGISDIRTQPAYTAARKRSFRRAMVRAQAQGSTWYRGRQLTLQQLSGTRGRADTSSQPRRHRQSAVESAGVRSDFPCILSWNVGGLSNSILDELFIWLSRHKHIKIVLLQETRWQFSSEWVSEDWHITHGGHTKQKGSGVMTLISKDLCSAADIRVSEVASGRILHTRIPGAGGLNHLDVINVYQHAWDQRADASELKRKRTRILEMLDSCIQQVPWRNLCVCVRGILTFKLRP